MKTLPMLLLFLLLTACVTIKTNHGVPNLAQVEPGIWRGGQPTAEGWQYLKSLGVRTSIKLNLVCEGSDDLAVSNGLRVVYLPISTVEQTIGKPKVDRLYKAVSCLTNNVFIHCTHGQDRTGLVVGAYRVRVCHWSKPAAYREMEQHGFHPLLRELYWSWEGDVP